MSWNDFLRKVLGAVSGILYNGTAEGGFPDDKKRSNQGIFLQKRAARVRGTDPVLHLQIRLHEERRARLCMALDTLRAAYLVSIGCASGSYRVVAPWVEESPYLH